MGGINSPQNHKGQKNKAEPEVLIWKSNSFEKIAYDIKSGVMSRYQTHTSSYMGVNLKNKKKKEKPLYSEFIGLLKNVRAEAAGTYMVHIKIHWTKWPCIEVLCLIPIKWSNRYFCLFLFQQVAHFGYWLMRSLVVTIIKQPSPHTTHGAGGPAELTEEPQLSSTTPRFHFPSPLSDPVPFTLHPVPRPDYTHTTPTSRTATWRIPKEKEGNFHQFMIHLITLCDEDYYIWFTQKWLRLHTKLLTDKKRTHSL